MEIRKAVPGDLPAILGIYERARTFMAEHGNPRQWGSVWPPEELIREDIRLGDCHVLEQDGAVEAVFYYRFYPDLMDADHTYDVIHDGSWKSDTPYGVVHRIASSGRVKGAGAFCIRWACEKAGHLRMDTHGDNYVMQSLLTKLGFQYCGVIYVVEDNDPRRAYEWVPTEF